MMWGYNGFGFGGGWMGIGMLLFWALIIFGIVALVRAFSGTSGFTASQPRMRDKTALKILSERYARGEIDKAEFEQKRNDLRA